MSRLYGMLVADQTLDRSPRTITASQNIHAWVQTETVRASIRIDLGTGMIVYELYRVCSRNAVPTPFYTKSIPLDVAETGELDATGVPPDEP